MSSYLFKVKPKRPKSLWLRSLGAGIAGLVIGTSAIAAEGDTAKLDKVEVTGSHIKRVDIEGPSPVLVIDRDDIDRSGANTINDILKNLAENTAGNLDDQFSLGFARTSAGVDLRGFGLTRTLVLINGRRLPVFPFGQNGSESFVDLNLIPLGAVERIEILKDGASAIYGSDAIAGVVNIILRKELDRPEFTVGYGDSANGGGEERTFQLVGGATGGKSNFLFVLDHLDRDSLQASDRDYAASANGYIDDRSSTGNPGTIFRSPTGPAAGASEHFSSANTTHPSKECPTNDIVPTLNGTKCVFDYASYVSLIPAAKRTSAMGVWNHEINNSLEAFARLNLTRSNSARAIAPAPDRFAISATNPNNPYSGEDISIAYRLLELGPRVDETTSNAYSLLGGLKGNLGISWDWELAAGYSRIDVVDIGTSGYATVSGVEEAIENGDLNPFDDTSGFDAESVSYEPRRDGESTLLTYDYRMSGDIVDMPHGVLSLAAGIEWRKETFSDQSDAPSENNDIIGSGGTSADGQRDAKAAYLEFSIPLSRKAQMQVAGRVDDYSDFGSTFNPKAAIEYRPVSSLLLRASAGTGFKAPALHELYTGSLVSFLHVKDVRNCNVAKAANDSAGIEKFCNGLQEIPVVSQGNPDLDAEESISYNLGTVWQTTRNLSIGADIWYIKNENAVSDNPQFLLDNEETSPDFAAQIIRDDPADPDNEIDYILNEFQNVAAQKLYGIDFTTNYQRSIGRASRFSTSLSINHLLSFKEQPAPGADFAEYAGNDGIPDWRANADINFMLGKHETGLGLTYIGGYSNEGDFPGGANALKEEVGSWTTIDLLYAYNTPWASKISLGIKNVFDTDPPADPDTNGWPFYNQALHSPRGRYYYARYKQQF